MAGGRARVEQVVTEAAAPVAAEHGCVLVDVEFTRAGGRPVLRVTIDKPGGVTLDDCERISRSLGVRLDVLDPIAESYALEVCSPGLDRPLKRERDFDLFRGRRVVIRTYAPLPGAPAGGNLLRGELLGREEGKVAVRDDQGRVWHLEPGQIARARLDPGF